MISKQPIAYSDTFPNSQWCHCIQCINFSYFAIYGHNFRCLSAPPDCIWCKKRRSHSDPLAIGCVKRGTIECPEDDIKEADSEVTDIRSTPLSKAS